MRPRPLRLQSSPASGKRNVASAHGRRTSARYATAALQNPLAPVRHAVFGLNTFSHTKTVPRKPKTSVEPKPAETVSAAANNGKTNAPEPKKKARAAAAPAKKKKPAVPK